MARHFYYSNLPVLFIVRKNSDTKKVWFYVLNMKSTGTFDWFKILIMKSTGTFDLFRKQLVKLFSKDRELNCLFLSS